MVFVSYTAQLLLVAAAIGQPLDPAAAWGALGLGIIVGVLSLLPFGLGSADLVVAGLLVVAGVPGRRGGRDHVRLSAGLDAPARPARRGVLCAAVGAAAARSRERGGECRECRPGGRGAADR